MAGDLWNRMVSLPDEAATSEALGRVRERAELHRRAVGRRRRAIAIAAAFVLTFVAGWAAGQASAGRGARWAWELRGQSIEESRATFVAVPAGDQ